jgi:hypothetical protein
MFRRTIKIYKRFITRADRKNVNTIKMLAKLVTLFVFVIIMIPFGIYASYLLNKEYDFTNGTCEGHWFCENTSLKISPCSQKSYYTILIGCGTVGTMTAFLLGLAILLFVLPFILIYKLVCNIISIAENIFVTTLKILSIVSMIVIVLIPLGILSSYMLNYNYVYATGNCIGYWYCINNKGIYSALCSKETYISLIFGCTCVGSMVIIIAFSIFVGVFICCNSLYISTRYAIKEIAVSIKEVDDIESAIVTKRLE